MEWIVVAEDRGGKIEDFAVCNSLALARMYADGFAKSAPPRAIISIFESRPIERRNGTKSD